MASGGKGTRWGSLLSQAVAGVEARLDTMLAEADEASRQPAKPPAPAPAKQTVPTRSGSSARTNDRLQERLARAVAAKNAGASRGQSPAATGKATPTPSVAADSPRQSIDLAGRASVDSVRATKTATGPRPSTDSTRPSPAEILAVEAAKEDEPGKPKDESADTEAAIPPANATEQTPEPPVPDGTSERSTPAPVAPDTPEALEALEAPDATTEGTATEEPTDTDSAQLAKTLQETLREEQRQHQEETHYLTEKIDALQAKLQYLAREAAEAAKKAVQEAAPGSVDKKLAEKDKQIAGLLEEGKNLGITEQKHRALLKKLRAKMADDEKAAADVRGARAKAEAELQTLRPRARRLPELEKAHEDGRRQLAQTQADLASQRAERTASEGIVAALRAQLDAANERAERAVAKAQDGALEAARQQIRELEEQVATLQLEKSLAADRAKAQVAEWRDKAERAEERARVAEIEALAEVQVVEGKLEVVRARAEEASSGASGDSQAKLLRQIETLQSQYAIASENWQGIEATLLSRVSALEKDRDEAQQRESEMRKKAREAALRAKRLEEDLEDMRSTLPRAEEDAGAYQTQIAALQKRAEEAETALQRARTDLESHKAAAAAAAEKEREREQNPGADRERDRDVDQDSERGRDRELQRREPPDLRRTWLDGLPGRSTSNSRPQSPLVVPGSAGGPSRAWSSEFLGLQGLPNKLRKVSAPSSHDDPAERFSLRRPSGQPPVRPAGLASLASLGFGSSNSSHGLFSPTTTEAGTGSVAALGPEDAIDEPPERAVSPPPSAAQQPADLVSVSTVAAGPSVQLVERMSAAIRRLESEKVAAREELARISSQRNEARSEVLALLKDAEAGKAAAARVATLETEVAEMQSRYETTLELLGEKSEMVDELRADVQDMKAMYRDLVERSIQ